MKLCVVNSSGGLDSSTLMRKALDEGFKILPINYNYGQKNIVEMSAQKQIVNQFKKQFPDMIMDTIVIDFTQTFGDAIKTFQNNRDSGKTEDEIGMKYYMPSRNLLFMSTSAVIGEILALDENIKEIYLGLGIHKHSDIYERDYWDISPEFAEKLQDLLSLNDSTSVKVYAPYKDSFKSKIIEDMVKFNIPYRLTWTCYDPVISYNEKIELNLATPCKVCEACLERSTQANNVVDGFGEIINDYTLEVNFNKF